MRNKIKPLILALCLFPCIATGQIQTVQYWFDDDFAGRQTQNLTASQTIQLSELNTSSLPAGIHLAHIRAKDNTNWSVVHTQMFYKLPVVASEVGISRYEYWIDNNFAAKQSGTLSGGSATITELDVDTYSEGMHILHIRAIDNVGRYTPVHSQLFYKLAANASANEIAEYEYWLDGDFANRSSVAASGKSIVITDGIDMTGIAEGFHTIFIRARDNQNRWSGVHTQAFYVNKAIAGGENQIAAYRYWYDYDFGNHALVTLDEPVNPYELKTKWILPVDFAEGETHTFHIQFSDLAGRWSTVATDTFKVVPLFSETEFDALKAFYQSTGGDEWLNTQAGEAVWNIEDIETVNDWKGISITEGRTSGITLTANNLTGNIPEAIVEGLPYLETLRVDSNSITGIEAALPTTIALNVKTQDFVPVEFILPESGALDIPVNTISRYKHSSGVFTEDYRFEIYVNDTYKTRVYASEGIVSVASTYLKNLEEGDLIKLIQYTGDAEGSVYTYVVTAEKNPTGIAGTEQATVQLYPNPVQDGFFVAGFENSARLVLSDLSGRTIRSETIMAGRYVSISDLPGGVYIVVLKTETGTIEHKIIKM